MNVARISFGCILLALMAATSSASQELTLDQVLKAAKIYLRDTAEFPLRMAVDFKVIDSTGRVRQHKSGKFNYDFHGYNSRSQRAGATLRGPRSAVKPAVSATLATILPSAMLSPNAEKNYKFSFLGPVGELLSARLTLIPACTSSSWRPDAYVLVGPCGSHEIQLQKDDLELKYYSFDAGGLPVQANIDVLGPVTVTRYHVGAEFQKVFAPGDPKPFLVPKQVTLTVETDKGNLLLSGDFTVKTVKK